MPRNTLRLLLAAVLPVVLLGSAKPDPVQWTATASRDSRGALVVSVRASIEDGWYIYSMQQPADGPAPLRFRTTPATAGRIGNVTAPAPRVSYDQGFRARVGKYYGNPVFLVPVQIGTSSATVPLEIRYQACNDTICLPPRTKTVQARVTTARR